MGIDWQWDVVTSNQSLLWHGLWLTVIYTVISSACGLAVGTILAMGRMSLRFWIRWPCATVLEVVRGVPLLVLLIWFYYALPIMINVTISAPTAAAIALSTYAAPYYGEIVRGGILSVDPGQIDAALSIGMTYFERMRRIVLPQAFRRMVPPLVNQTVVNLKNTSLASVVTVGELVYEAQALSAQTYRPMEVYTAAAILYLIVVLPSTFLARRLELTSRHGVQRRRWFKDLRAKRLKNLHPRLETTP